MTRTEVNALMRAASILAPQPMMALITRAGTALAHHDGDLGMAADWLADIMPALRSRWAVVGMLQWMCSVIQEYPQLAVWVTKPGYFWDHLAAIDPAPPAQHAANLLVCLRRQIGS